MESQLPSVLSANEAYQGDDFTGAPGAAQPRRGLVILTCMDVRLDPARAFGLQLGDAHVLRNAGGRVSDDALRSLIISAHLLGTREAGVVHHTKCGLEGLTNEDAAARTGVSGVDFLGFTDLEGSVRDDVQVLRACEDLPPDFVTWGAVYDVDTGALRVVTDL